MTRDTRLEVDLDVVRKNFRETRKLLDEPPAPPPAGLGPAGGRVRMAAVVKANAYGLGAVRVARELLEEGADCLAVACLPEALELRRAYPAAELLVMGHTPTRYLETAVAQRVVTTIFDLPQAEALSAAAKTAGTTARAQLKVDSGMNRLGLKPGPGSADLVEAMASRPGLELEGIFTHLALEGRDSDHRQFGLFMEVVEKAAARGVRFRMRHICDSIGLLRYPEWRLDMVRAGAILFGVKPMRAPLGDRADIGVPMALRSRLARVRRLEEGEGVGYDYTFRAPAGGALVGTVPIGYADGYERGFSNKAEVLVRGRRARVVGLICMDQLNVDLSAIPEAREGDEVLLFGKAPAGSPPDGAGDSASLDLNEVAQWAGSNRNSVIASVGRRVPRAYYRGGRLVDEVDYLLQGD